MSKKSVDITKKTIMVFGTFDGLHQGHLNFLKQARNLHQFSKLVVSIARDKNVLKIKGSYPSFTEKERVNLLNNCALADRVILSGLGDHIPHILRIRPDIIALGYDQREYVKNLKRDLKNKGLLVRIVRLKPYQEKKYKNHLLKKIS